MAEIVKPKDLAKVLEAIPESQVASAAEELGVTSKQLSGFIKKPTGKAFQKIAETLGEGIEGAQKFVDKFLKREPTELEKVGVKAAEGGIQPPKVQPEFAKEELGKERGFQMPGQPGGPLATTPPATPPAVIPKVQEIPEQQPGRLATLGTKLEQAKATEIGPKLLSAGKASEVVAEPTMTKAPMQAAMEAAQAPKMSMAKKAGAAAVGLAIGAGFAKEANAPQAVREANIDKPADVAPLVKNAVDQNAITPDQQQVLIDQANQLQQAAESLESKLTRDYEKKQARLELMKLTETIMHGLVTAIGANALLQRGSPYAVDFSQGPKTDWNAEFDRLQKDYTTQMGAILQKYKLESTEKRAAAAEAGREARFEKMMGFREKQLEAEQQKKQTEATTKAAEKKLTEKEKAFAELSGAIASLGEKATPISVKQVTANATKLGIPKEQIDLLINKTTGKGIFNVADKEKVAEILEQYRPGAQAAQNLVTVEVDGQVGQIPADQVEAFKKQYPNAKVR